MPKELWMCGVGVHRQPAAFEGNLHMELSQIAGSPPVRACSNHDSRSKSALRNLMAPWVAISLLAKFASGSCLPDAIPPAQRQNLVNVNGETYPVGVFVCNWAASFASNILAATLVEEVLGYNVTLNLDSLGGGTVAGYYGVAGCRDPNNVADRGCNQGVTYYHFQLEAWMGLYPNDWQHIQDTYPSMAPKDLGGHGYTGLQTMYIPKPIQKQAYTTKGMPLEWYRSWNVSWNDPAAFFGSISAVDTSKLMPCNASGSVMANDPTMRRHVEITGDSDGVTIKDETWLCLSTLLRTQDSCGSPCLPLPIHPLDVYSARCDDGFWWRAPSCRQTGDCVPWVTAGTGWGNEEFMQKFTIFQMPCAIAVSGSWTDYTQLPLSGDMSFYWWTPDPTFLELSPMPVDFPAHKAAEFARNIQTSQPKASVISSIASPDLAILAPLIESFADKVEMPLSTIDALLLDQKETADTWQDVTCRWIKANQAVWRRWIPDESECFPGFGLYDSVLNDFVDERANASNKIVCQACPAGTFSQSLEDDAGTTYVCVPCGKGTSQDSGASLSCKPCQAGEYQDEVKGKECKRCAIGTYQDEIGQEVCKVCPASTSTNGLGSRSESYCGCPEDYIDMNRGFNCVKCMEGLDCPALSQLVVLECGESDLDELAIPQVKAGYYSDPGKPTEAAPDLTPPLDVCNLPALVTRLAHAVFQAQRGQGLLAKIAVLAIAGTFAFLILAYYLTTSKVTAKASVLFATTASIGMLVMSMQNLGLIGMMTVEWPLTLQGLFSICKFLLLDIDSYGFVCVAGCLTNSSNRRNGLQSLLKYPGVICGSSDHQTTVIVGVTILTVFVPAWSAQRQDDRVAAFRFLIFRFRLDSWWFGVPLLLRGPLISLPVVLATDYPSIQVVSIAMILTSFMVPRFKGYFDADM
eukprot:s328_g17.t1